MSRSLSKTKVLVDAILIYMTCEDAEEETYFLAAPSVQQGRHMIDDIVHILNAQKIGFKYWRTNGSIRLVVGSKTLRLVHPQGFLADMITSRIDAIFIQDCNRMPVGFQDFIDQIMRPCVVVIETSSNRKKFDNVEYQATI